jgi:hypothetical protein
METKTSSGIATTSANPLLSIANTSLSKSSSTFEFVRDDGSSEIDVHNEVFDNDVTQFKDSKTPNESCHIFQPSQRKKNSVNNIDIMLHNLILKHNASLLL